MIIGLTGMPGSGKSTVAEYLKERYGFSLINMGDIVRNAMSDEGLEINSDSLRAFSESMRKTYGYAAVAQMVVNAVGRKYKGRQLCIDGIRSPWEIRYFKDNLSDAFIVLAIESPEDVRHGRLLARSRGDDPETRDGLSKRDAKEVGFGVLEAIKLADFKIYNVSTVDAMYKEIETVLKAAKKSKGNKP